MLFDANSAANTRSVGGESIPGGLLAEQKKSVSPKKSSAKKATGDKKRRRAGEQGTQNRTALLLKTLLMAELAMKRGMIQLAVKNYLEAAQLSRDVNIAERATQIAINARDEAGAMKAARLWVELDSSNIEAHRVMATLLVRNGRTKEALRHLEAVIADGTPHEEQSYMLIASLLRKERDRHAAMQVMEKLVAKRSGNINALFAYSQLAFMVGEYKKAEVVITKAIAIKDDWPQAHIMRTTILSRQGRDKEALQYLDDVVNRYPNIHELRLNYARKLVDARELARARDQFRELADHPDKVIRSDAVYALGLLSMELSDRRVAAGYFEKLVEMNMRSNEASYHLGQIEERDGDINKAIQHYSLVRYGDYNIDALIRIAVLTARMGKVADAREQLKNIYRDAKTADIQMRIYLAEGEILRNDKQYEEAFSIYTEALAELPDNIELLYARALTAEKLDRIDVAVQDLKAIVKRQPNNAQALNALGYTMVDRTDRIEEGAKYVERAYQINSRDAAIIDSMGWVYYRRGKYPEALSFLRKAFEISKDSDIAAHLGEVLWVSGDQRAAREVWEEALRETPSHKILLDVMKRFTE
ncbi:MAG: tetratricopeptide repeat protein [Gammaproteobacteria bacterium]|nr:tetratricopeptide repeat protein [Gammaproteobacteria bacterium]MDH5652410.1 tetratricopeptide repeat protein [Gammaproteobacteria bacterium]